MTAASAQPRDPCPVPPAAQRNSLTFLLTQPSNAAPSGNCQENEWICRMAALPRWRDRKADSPTPGWNGRWCDHAVGFGWSGGGFPQVKPALTLRTTFLTDAVVRIGASTFSAGPSGQGFATWSPLGKPSRDYNVESSLEAAARAGPATTSESQCPAAPGPRYDAVRPRPGCAMSRPQGASPSPSRQFWAVWR